MKIAIPDCFVFRSDEGDSHRYIRKSDGLGVVGVTTILKQEAKPFLIQWAASEAVSHVLKNWEPDKKYTREQIDSVCGTAKTAHRQKNKDACVHGTDTHTILEMYVTKCISGDKEGAVKFLLSSATSDAQKSQFTKLVEWEKVNEVEYLASELVVGDEKMDYAGTCDILYARGNVLCAGDFKTSNTVADKGRLYTGNALQLAAYQGALESMGFSVKIGERHILHLPREKEEFEDYKVKSNYEKDYARFVMQLMIYRDMVERGDIK